MADKAPTTEKKTTKRSTAGVKKPAYVGISIRGADGNPIAFKKGDVTVAYATRNAGKAMAGMEENATNGVVNVKIDID